jgi:hypothetical protein
MGKYQILTFKAACLITGILLVLASDTVSSATEVDIFQERIDRLIYGEVYTTFGKIESEIRSRIGAPEKIETRDIPNPHVAGTSDKHIKLVYKDLSIDLLRSGATGKDLLVRIVLEDPGYALSGEINVGSKRADLETYLGSPWKTDDSGNLVYGDAERNSKVIFKLAEERVTSITWSYYFD